MLLDRIFRPSGIILAVVFIAFVVRLMLIVASPPLPPADMAGGDSRVLMRVAENIVTNNCVSLSTPLEATCRPHVGGAQLPLYPAFLAAAWPSGKNTGFDNIQYLQALIAALAIARLMWAVLLWSRSNGMALGAGLVLALSPLSVSWSRILLTESLAISISTWVLAEILLSIHERRLRLIWLAVSFSAAIWLRYDMVVLALPIAVAGFSIHSPKTAFFRGTILAALVSVPLGLWAWRSIDAGITSLPTFLIDRSEVYDSKMKFESPVGLFKWTRTWTRGWEDNRMVFDYVIPPNTYYLDISVPEYAYEGASDRTVAEELFRELKTYNGKPVPHHIDQKFLELADRRISDNPIYFLIEVPLRRMLFMWFSVKDTAGWPTFSPTSLTDQVLELRPKVGYMNAAFEVFVRHPFAFFVKAMPIFWRALILIALAIAVANIFLKRRQPYYAFAVMTVVFALGRTALPSILGSPRSRYLVEAAPWIEVLLICLIISLISSWRSKNKPTGQVEQRGGII